MSETTSFIFILPVCVATACTAPPPSHTYVLDPRSVFGQTPAPPPNELPFTVAVQAVDAARPYATRDLAYRNVNNPAELQYADTHRWAAAPPDLMQDALVYGLRDTGIFEAVWRYGPLPTDYVLWATLRRLEVIYDGEMWEVCLSLDMVATRGDTDEIVYSNHFDETESVGGKDRAPVDAAKAMNKAISELVMDLARDLAISMPATTETANEAETAKAGP